MTTETQRAERLKQWLDEFDGKIANFCRQYNLTRARASYLSQVLSGSRKLGERAARKLEAECNRPAGWLDMGIDPVQNLRYDAARVAQLPQGDRELVEGFIEFVLQRWERRSVQQVSAAPMTMTDEFTPPAQQIEAIQEANRKPRKKTDIGQNANRKRKTA